MTTCPQCSLQTPQLFTIPADLRAKIKDVDPHYVLENQICKSCTTTLQRQAVGGKGILIQQERAKEMKKKRLWQNRVALVRNGHALMKNKLFSEAAISYEKYLRLVEVVFNCAPGQLTPEMLKESAKTAELTVIAGVYWDLLRIYDSADKYSSRQKFVAKQLAKFVSYTPIYSDLIKKAQLFMKSAQHPDTIKSFLTASKAQRPRCFIATSAFAVPMSDEVTELRLFRDEKLKPTFFGRKIVFIYYKFSPKVASLLDRHPSFKPYTRVLLRFVIKCARYI